MDNKKIKSIIELNKKLAKSLNLAVGDRFILNKDYGYYKKNDIFTISLIHSLYFWVLFKDTKQLPQGINDLLKIGDFEK